MEATLQGKQVMSASALGCKHIHTDAHTYNYNKTQWLIEIPIGKFMFFEV